MKSDPNFEIFEEIGRGSFATVYRARDLTLRRDVAVKELHEKYRRDPQHLQHFLEEAQFLAGIRHDNIVQIYSVDKERGWIIMELMQGSLGARAADGPLPPDLVRSVLRQSLAALEGLHQKDKLHGAVRPGNLLIDARGRIKLSDSAGVSLGGEIRKPTGSAKYLAPELLNPQFGEVTPGADLYCLGFTALELLMGPRFNTLFKGVGADAIDPELAWLRWHSAAAEKLAPVATLLPHVPPDLAGVIDRLLAKPVRDRYQSAGEALRDLDDRPLVMVEPAAPTAKRPAVGSGPAVVPVGQAPPAPPVPPVVRAAPPAPAPKPVAKAGRQANLWTREGINQRLSNPYVLYPLLALIVLPTIVFFFWEPDEGTPVVLDSVPAGARVMIDDKPAGKTKGRFTLAPGKHRLRLELKDHAPLDAELVVGAEPLSPAPYQLAPLQTPPAKVAAVTPPEKKAPEKEKPTPPSLVTLRITSTPDQATVFIDDRPQAQKTNGDFQVTPGPHEIKIVHDGRTETRRVTAEPGGKEQVVSANFPPPPAAPRVAISSVPPRAKVFVNGQLVGLTDGEFDLKPGRHDLRIEAPPGSGRADITQEVRITTGPGPQRFSFTLLPARQERYALLVGVTKPGKGVPDFVHATADVDTLGRTLVAGGYKGGNVKVLAQPLGKPTAGAAADRSPNSANIRTDLDRLSRECTPGDTLVLALVGRQVQLPGGPESYFCPVDADPADRQTLLPLADVYRALAECKAGTRVLILDGWRRAGDSSTRRAATVAAPDGVSVLCGCAVGEAGYTHPDARHGLFMEEVCRGLQGEADADDDQRVTTAELAGYVEKRVPAVAQTFGGMQHVESTVPKEAGSQALNQISPGLARYKAGSKLLADGMYAQAAAAFDEAAAALPAFLEAFTQRAAAHYQNEQYAEALEDCDKALAVDANNPTALAYRGEIHLARKDYDAALASHDAAIRLEPGCALGYNDRGQVHSARKDAKAALADYSEAVRLNPAFKWAYYNRGLVNSRQSAWDAAIQDFTKVVALDPANVQAHLQRSVASRKKGDVDRAIADATRAIELNGKSSTAYQYRGLAYASRGRHDDAIRDYTRALEIDPKNAFAWNDLGVSQAAKKELDRAIDSYTEAISLRKNVKEFWNNRGISLRGKGLLDEAIQDFTQAVTLSPAYAAGFYQRSLAYEAKGDKSRAEQDRRQARKLDPNVGADPGS